MELLSAFRNDGLREEESRSFTEHSAGRGHLREGPSSRGRGGRTGRSAGEKAHRRLQKGEAFALK